MPKLKGKQTFPQFIRSKHPKVYEEHRDKVLFTLKDVLSLHSEWQHERKTELRMVINNMEKED